MNTIVSKGEFARLKQRAPSCVTKWIKLGKISAAALVGEGNAAKLWLERADADLAASLDPAQQSIQPAPVTATALLSPGAAPATGDEQAVGPRPVNPGAEREADLARRAKADADKAEQEAIAAARRNSVEDGRWVNAEEAARAFADELRRFIAETETFLATTLARSLAEAHGIDFKATSVEIRNLYRKHRMSVAERAEADLKEPVVDERVGRSGEAGAHGRGEGDPAAPAG